MNRSSRARRDATALCILLSCIGSLAQVTEARACGCFTPPGPATPVVQAGERIVFRVKDGTVTAHIQIQYSGKADEFGWLLPLPSVPTLQVGTTELFDVLERNTAPRFISSSTFDASDCGPAPSYNGNRGGGGSGFGCGASTVIPSSGGACKVDADCGPGGQCLPGGSCLVTIGAGGTTPPPPDFATPVAVAIDTIGPYDYAVLKADDKGAMLDWLKQNRFFVPGTNDQALAPYVHPGAYFLALKLKSGKDAGDIQPIVVSYASDLPMIPLVLTSVGAVPDMNVEAFLLGPSRAIPRNFHHAVLDDAAMWVDGKGYDQVLRAAVHEAPGNHAFVTEYAGGSDSVSSDLSRPTVEPLELAAITDIDSFLVYLDEHGVRRDAGWRRVMEAHIEEPVHLVEAGVSRDAFYDQLRFWVSYWRAHFTADAPIVFDPVKTAEDVMARLVNPRLGAARLFDDHPYLTRLRTLLSPEDMTADPVFSFNPSLPEVSSVHKGLFEQTCLQRAVLVSDPHGDPRTEGLRFAQGGVGDLPTLLRLELLREEGPPEIVKDHLPELQARVLVRLPAGGQGQAAKGGTTGCSVTATPANRGAVADLALLALVAVALRTRRRSR